MLQRKVYRLSTLCSAVLFVVVLAGLPATTLYAAAGADPEAGFAELYAHILQSADSGRLDRSMARKARAINTTLQKEILAIDARITELKNASAKADGARREKLLDELVDLGSRRERVFFFYRRQLERLAGDQKGDAVISTRPGHGTEATIKEDVRTKTSPKRTILFENVPEDISTGQFD